MNTRSVKTKNDVQSARGDSSTSIGLDENLWGNLQYHIDLAELVYPKLPFEEFFHLRIVCKDWYVIACKHLGLKEPIHKPFFNLINEFYSNQLDGILIYNASSRSWNWRLRRSGYTFERLFAFVASKGVVFSLAGSSSYCNHASVFHWQSKICQNLDLPPNLPLHCEGMVLGMIVSEKQDPLSSFRVVLGNPDFDTQVYESGVWQTKPCRVPRRETRDRLWRASGCVDCNGRVYIISNHDAQVIFVYDFENAKWSSILCPNEPYQYSLNTLQYNLIALPYNLNTLGVWNSRIFNMTFQSKPQKGTPLLMVWELVDETLHKWKVYAHMPKDLWSWLQSPLDFLSFKTSDEVYILSNFCGGFMLAYSWNYRYNMAERFCLFNIATKNWQKLNVATIIVSNRE